MIEIPEGWVLVPKGGRPKKTARQIAVFLALNWREEREREKRWMAMDWALEHWNLADAAAVRREVRKARGELPKQGFIVHGEKFAMYVAAPDRVVRPGAKGWLWACGTHEVVELMVAPPPLATTTELRDGLTF